MKRFAMLLVLTALVLGMSVTAAVAAAPPATGTCPVSLEIEQYCRVTAPQSLTVTVPAGEKGSNGNSGIESFNVTANFPFDLTAALSGINEDTGFEWSVALSDSNNFLIDDGKINNPNVELNTRTYSLADQAPVEPLDKDYYVAVAVRIWESGSFNDHRGAYQAGTTEDAAILTLTVSVAD